MEKSIKTSRFQWLTEKTSTLPFVIGLFVGVMVFNTDVVTNLIVTAVGAGSWHFVRLFTIGH